MSASDILRQLEQLAIVSARNGKIRIEASKPLPGKLVEAARKHKKEILELLSKPRLDAHGRLVIPFDADPKYHWWAGGQSIRETLQELKAPPELVAKYVEKGTA